MSSLWHPYDIPIIALAGESNSGKTMWGLTAHPDCTNFNREPKVLIWDMEKSSITYKGFLNFSRVDIPLLTSMKYGDNYTPANLFSTWMNQIKELDKKAFDICILDTISEIEDGLTAYIQEHPGQFGYTKHQFESFEGIFWGVVKAEWRKILLGISHLCESLILTIHMKNEFKGPKPTGRRIPRGKETIMDIASLYLTLTRTVKAGKKVVQSAPSGICKWPQGKSRLLYLDRESKETRQVLPPHIPDASPDGIRKYLVHPVNLNNLKPDERAVPETELSEEDRLILQAGIASDNAAAAEAQLKLKGEIIPGETPPENPRSENPCPVGAPPVNPPSESPSSGSPNPRLEKLRKRVLSVMTGASARKLLTTRYKATKLISLTPDQVSDLEVYIGTLGK